MRTSLIVAWWVNFLGTHAYGIGYSKKEYATRNHTITGSNTEIITSIKLHVAHGQWLSFVGMTASKPAKPAVERQ